MAEVPSSFLKGLFAGQVLADAVRPYPFPDAETRETADMIVDSWRRFAADHVDPEAFEKQEEVPAEVLRGMAELGFLGLTIPEEYGGYGAPSSTFCRFQEEICYLDASVSTVTGGHLSLCAKSIMLGADDEQKKLWLPDMATGEKLGGFALTEAEAGSDARALTSTAEQTESGWVLNGSKVWCTNGGIARFLTVFANTTGEDGKKRTSAFLVPSPSPGLAIGGEEEKMGLKASSTVSFTMSDVPIPANHLLGRPGKGFHLALGVLDTGRLGIGAVALGQARRMLDEACGHALDRRQFGAPIATFEMIRDKFAHMAAHVYAMESVIGLTAGLADRGDGDFALESAAVKIYCTEAAWWSINEALQIAGGMGFMKEVPYERFLRDARVNMIFEGTNEIMRSFLALSGCRAAAGLLGGGHKPSGDGFGALPDALADHGEAFDRDARLFSEAVGAVLRSHGHDLVEREYLQTRLADALMALWVRAACLARTAALIEEKGQQDTQAETLLCRHACTTQEGRTAAALRALEENQDERSTEVSERVYGAKGYSWGPV